MKRKTIVALFLATALALAGCGKDEKLGYISYISSESAVYSTTAEVVAEVADAVVEIATESVSTSFGTQYIVSGAGSGVIVSKGEGNYLIVTNDHVAGDAQEITVRTRAGKTYEAECVASDDSADIAVVSIETNDELKLAVWGDSDSLKTGEDAIAIGNPLGNLGGTVTKGIISALGRTIAIEDYPMTLIQTDAAINPGNSGGGLFNMRGELIGVVNAKTSREGIEGLCFAIPANAARAAFESLAEHGYLEGRATFGIEVASASLSNGSTAVYVTALGRNAADGFELYDRIYKIGGAEITSVLAYNVALSALKVGDSVRVEVCRGTLSQSVWGSSLSFDAIPTGITVTAAQYGL